jgi:hypothetical protein
MRFVRVALGELSIISQGGAIGGCTACSSGSKRQPPTGPIAPVCVVVFACEGAAVARTGTGACRSGSGGGGRGSGGILDGGSTRTPSMGGPGSGSGSREKKARVRSKFVRITVAGGRRADAVNGGAISRGHASRSTLLLGASSLDNNTAADLRHFPYGGCQPPALCGLKAVAEAMILRCKEAKGPWRAFCRSLKSDPRDVTKTSDVIGCPRRQPSTGPRGTGSGPKTAKRCRRP